MTLSAHPVPRWFGEDRYGMFVHANIASVPAFAPVHEYADWYWAFVADEPKPDVLLHPPTPLPEVKAWHAEHFGTGFAFDEFIPLLTYEHWDAGAVAQLAVDAGMRYVVHVTKHHDGFCWWDSALTGRTSARQGPRRDVTAELATASRAAGLVFGVYYSLLDWAHPAYPDPEGYVDAYMRPQLAELVERFEPAVLWGDGHWGHTAEHWRADAIVADYHQAMAALGLGAAVNDRFMASHADFATFEYEVPDTPPPGAWELCRGLAHSFCWNRAEEDDDHLDARAVVTLLTKTVAKGGNLLLNIGPRADGTIPEIQARVLHEAGSWVRAHADAIHGSRPFEHWGDETTRYTVGAGGRVFAIDLENAPERVFGGLTGVAAVDGAAEWAERTDGLHVRRMPDAPETLASVYRVKLGEREHAELRAREPRPGRVAIGSDAYPSIGAALAAARSGDAVELMPGHFGAETETFPLRVPAGVTVRGPREAALHGDGKAVVELVGDAAALEGLTVTGGPHGYMFVPPTGVVVRDASGVAIVGCRLTSVVVYGGTGHWLHDNDVARGNLWLLGATACVVTRNRQRGLRWGTGIDVSGGADHVIEGNRVGDDLCGIRLHRTATSRVETNHVGARWWGVQLRHASGTLVLANRVERTMRATCVEGGDDTLVEANTAWRCDSGVLVEQGATRTTIGGNTFERCRVGILVWGASGTELVGNVITASRDHDLVTRPDAQRALGS